MTAPAVWQSCLRGVGQLLAPVFIAAEKIGDKVERNADDNKCFPHKHNRKNLD